MDSIFGRKKKSRVPTGEGLITSSNHGVAEVIGNSAGSRLTVGPPDGNPGLGGRSVSRLRTAQRAGQLTDLPPLDSTMGSVTMQKTLVQGIGEAHRGPAAAPVPFKRPTMGTWPRTMDMLIRATLHRVPTRAIQARLATPLLHQIFSTECPWRLLLLPPSINQ